MNCVIIYSFAMQIKISVDQAVRRLFGSDYQPIKDVSQVWYMFTGFKYKNSNRVDYFKIFQTPAYFHTSQQIYSRTLKQLLGLIHEIEVIFLQRNFQSSFFLLKSQTNIISFRSLLELRKHCNEKVQSSIVTKIIEFFISLEDRNSNILRQITLDRIGLTKNGNLKICDYLVYFMDTKESIQTDKKESINLKQNLDNLIQSLVMQDQTNMLLKTEDIYTEIVDYYGISYANFLSSILSLKSLKKDKILPLVKAQISIQTDDEATVTDSFRSNIDLQEDIQVTHGSFSNKPRSKIKYSQTTISPNKSLISNRSGQLSFVSPQSNSKVKKTLIAFGILLILAVAVGAIFQTLNYINKPIRCGQSEFVNERNQCISCSGDCQRCIGSGLDQCLSCKGQMFLVVQSQNSTIGYCKVGCDGGSIIFRTHTCLQPKQK